MSKGRRDENEADDPWAGAAGRRCDDPRAAAPEANASTLASQLRTSERELSAGEADLDEAHAALATALAEHRRRGLGTLILEVNKAKHASRSGRRSSPACGAARRASGRPRRREPRRLEGAHHPGRQDIRRQRRRAVSAHDDGVRRSARGSSASGKFYGLYQYALVTWRGDWNPWRGASVFDGGAQIKATAVAVKKGMGRALVGEHLRGGLLI